jgi:hypothetical protein
MPNAVVSRPSLFRLAANVSNRCHAWVEGLEINVLGLVLGVDIRRPAIKVPGFGRIGVPVA